ncbi:MAG: hypothetical protein JOZ40_04330 [Methylobacteriaceae bacterium]|nr:hypothetical protein [Methylobacteriaceae bacterium]
MSVLGDARSGDLLQRTCILDILATAPRRRVDERERNASSRCALTRIGHAWKHRAA